MAASIIGSVLHGRYRVERLLRAGGMAMVYVVYDSHLNLNSLVAKELDPAEFPSAEQHEYIELFAREASVLAPLRHPHIPRVSDFFEEDGKFYLVMDLVDGVDLETYLAHTGALSVTECLEIGITVCTVLEYLHSQHPPILHRDLKPANLIRRRADGLMIVIDFGIAKAIPPYLLGKTALLTQRLGTPGYAAPEQFGRKTTIQSDLYSLGATLHHLLSGIDPRDTFDQAPFQFMLLGSVRSDVASALEQLIEQMVQLAPAARPASATEVRLRLETIKAGTPILSSGLVPRGFFARLFPPAALSPTSRPTSPPGGSIQSFAVTINYDTTIDQMIIAGNYDFIQFGFNFTHNKSGIEHLIIEVVHFHQELDTNDVLQQLDLMGLRPATFSELLALGEQYPDVHRRFPIVALGSVVRTQNIPRVPYLSGNAAKRELNTTLFGRWQAHCHFAAVRK